MGSVLGVFVSEVSKRSSPSGMAPEFSFILLCLRTQCTPIIAAKTAAIIPAIDEIIAAVTCGESPDNFVFDSGLAATLGAALVGDLFVLRVAPDESTQSSERERCSLDFPALAGQLTP